MTTHRGLFAILVAGTLTSGCTTYTVRKSALAPHIAPPMRNGQGMGAADVEASLGASTLASATEPKEGEDANAGLYIPRVQLGAALRKQMSDNLDIGVLWDHGFRKGAYATSEDQPSPRGGSVYGGGGSVFWSLPASEQFRVGIGLDLILYSIPYIEYRTCIDFCGGEMYTDIDKDRDSIWVYSASIIPSWRTGRVTIFGGGTMRNHPTIEKGSIEGVLDSDDEVDNGPMNLLVHAGAEMEIGGGVRAMALVYQPITQDPVDYGPTFGLGLSVQLAKKRPPPPPIADPAPTPYPYYPPQPYPYPPPQYPPPYYPPQPAPAPAPEPAPPPPPPT